MKGDALLVILCIVLIYAAWVATGGPSRAFSTNGPFITPISRPGEQQQAYKLSAPADSVDPRASARQVQGTPNGSSTPNSFQRTGTPDRIPGTPY